MLTFNNNKGLKKELLVKLKHHQDLDTFIQRTWLDKDSGKVEGNGYKGCFYGCTMQTDENAIEKFSEKYHIDLWYCYITEKIFEGLPEKTSKKFPLDSIKIIPVGSDINKIKSLFHKKILEDQLKFVIKNSEQEKAILECIELFEKPFNLIEESAARSAESAAWSAAWSAESAAWSAESAARSAESAARSVESAARSAESAARSVESAAWSAARSAESAESAAWSVESAKKHYYIKLRDILFECINELNN